MQKLSYINKLIPKSAKKVRNLTAGLLKILRKAENGSHVSKLYNRTVGKRLGGYSPPLMHGAFVPPVIGNGLQKGVMGQVTTAVSRPHLVPVLAAAQLSPIPGTSLAVIKADDAAVKLFKKLKVKKNDGKIRDIRNLSQLAHG